MTKEVWDPERRYRNNAERDHAARKEGQECARTGVLVLRGWNTGVAAEPGGSRHWRGKQTRRYTGMSGIGSADAAPRRRKGRAGLWEVPPILGRFMGRGPLQPLEVRSMGLGLLLINLRHDAALGVVTARAGAVWRVLGGLKVWFVTVWH